MNSFQCILSLMSFIDCQIREISISWFSKWRHGSRICFRCRYCYCSMFFPAFHPSHILSSLKPEERQRDNKTLSFCPLSCQRTSFPLADLAVSECTCHVRDTDGRSDRNTNVSEEGEKQKLWVSGK